MCTRILIFLALISISAGSFSQINPYVVDVAPRIANGDTQISFIAVIPDGNINVIEKNWLTYAAKNSRGSATFSNGIHVQTNVINANVSQKPFDVNSTVVNKNDGVQLTVWINQNGAPFRGDGSRNNGDLAVQKYVRDFAIKEYKTVTHNQLIAAQNKQRILEREYAQLQKGNSHDKASVKHHAVDSNAYASKDGKLNSRDIKKSKHAKKENLSESETNSIQEQLAFKMVEIESQRKLVRDTKIKLDEIR